MTVSGNAAKFIFALQQEAKKLEGLETVDIPACKVGVTENKRLLIEELEKELAALGINVEVVEYEDPFGATYGLEFHPPYPKLIFEPSPTVTIKRETLDTLVRAFLETEHGITSAAYASGFTWYKRSAEVERALNEANELLD